MNQILLLVTLYIVAEFCVQPARCFVLDLTSGSLSETLIGLAQINVRFGQVGVYDQCFLVALDCFLRGTDTAVRNSQKVE